VSIRDMPAANSIGRQSTPRIGKLPADAPAVIARRPTSEAVSNPRPNRSPMLCWHGLSTEAVTVGMRGMCRQATGTASRPHREQSLVAKDTGNPHPPYLALLYGPRHLSQHGRVANIRREPMQRITMAIDEPLAKEFDALIAKRGYTSRSEAMRDLLRREVESNRLKDEGAGHCVASLSYVYNHNVRALGQRLTASQHEHHDLVIATLHVHLDHENCLETAVLQGPSSAVRRLADLTKAERGVRHVALNLITVKPGDRHLGPGAHQHHGHMHLIPQS